MRPGEKPVTLITGESVSNYSEAWRVECEARHVLTMPLEKRRAYISLVERKRGPEAGEKLKQLIRLLWNKRHEHSRHD